MHFPCEMIWNLLREISNGTKGLWYDDQISYLVYTNGHNSVWKNCYCHQMAEISAKPAKAYSIDYNPCIMTCHYQDHNVLGISLTSTCMLVLRTMICEFFYMNYWCNPSLTPSLALHSLQFRNANCSIWYLRGASKEQPFFQLYLPQTWHGCCTTRSTKYFSFHPVCTSS